MTERHRSFGAASDPASELDRPHAKKFSFFVPFEGAERGRRGANRVNNNTGPGKEERCTPGSLFNQFASISVRFSDTTVICVRWQVIFK